MKKQLEWNVCYHDVNSDKIKSYNILHQGFIAYLYKLKTKYLKKDNFQFDIFMEEVRKELMSHYWSRAEYEIIIKAWCGGKAEEKIDIYQQVLLNWDAFSDYLFNHIKDIKKER